MAEALFTLRVAPSAQVWPSAPSDLQRLLTLRQQVRGIDIKAAASGLVGSLVGVVESELYFSANVGAAESRSGAVHNSLRCVISISTLLLLYFVVQRDRVAADLSKLTGNTPRTGYWVYGEILVCALHWPPFADATFRFRQLHGTLRLTGDAIGNCLLLLRVYLAARLLGGFTKWMSPRALTACKQSRCEADVSFAFKAVLHSNPFRLLSLALVCSVVIFGVALRTFERPYAEEYFVGQDFDIYWNSMWLAIVSMTTVGYGDFYPRTHLGRVVAVFASFTGVFLVSLLVLALSSCLQFSKRQTLVFDHMGRQRAKVKCASLCVKSALWIHHLQRVESDRLAQAEWGRLREQLDRLARLRRYQMPVDDLCGQMSDFMWFWEADIEEQCAAVRSAVGQLDEMEKLQDEISLFLHRSTQLLRQRLHSLALRESLALPH